MTDKLTFSDLYIADKRQVRESELTIFDRYLFRPIGVLVAFFLYKYFGFTPNKITFASVVATVIGGFFLVTNQLELAVIFFLIFPILDCADGTLARAIGDKGKFGIVVDAVGGYSFIVIFWLSLSFYQSVSGNFLGEILSALILSINLWCRLYLNKKKAVLNDYSTSKNTENPRRSKLYHIYENFEFGSAQIPLFGLSLYLNLTTGFIVFYAMISACLVTWTIANLISSAKSTDF